MRNASGAGHSPTVTAVSEIAPGHRLSASLTPIIGRHWATLSFVLDLTDYYNEFSIIVGFNERAYLR